MTGHFESPRNLPLLTEVVSPELLVAMHPDYVDRRPQVPVQTLNDAELTPLPLAPVAVELFLPVLTVRADLSSTAYSQAAAPPFTPLTPVAPAVPDAAALEAMQTAAVQRAMDQLGPVLAERLQANALLLVEVYLQDLMGDLRSEIEVVVRDVIRQAIADQTRAEPVRH